MAARSARRSPAPRPETGSATSWNSQDSLVYLAQQTGGRGAQHQRPGRWDDARHRRHARLLPARLRHSIPANDRWDPNDIRIHVKRPGLTVRARRGLFGPAEKDRQRDAAPADPLVAATLSPFATGAIDVRLTTLFAHDKTAGSYVRSLFFIDPAGLTFAVGAEGDMRPTCRCCCSRSGTTASRSRRRASSTLRLDDDSYALMRQRGLLYSARLGIKEAGGYQIGPPCRTIAQRQSGRAPSSSRCRRSARITSHCRAS